MIPPRVDFTVAQRLSRYNSTMFPPAPATYEEWLDETFGRAVTGQFYPEFVHRDVLEEPAPVPAAKVIGYLTRVFENPATELAYFSDRQLRAGLWELGPGDRHCISDDTIPFEERNRLVAAVGTFFREFFDKRCLPELSHRASEPVGMLNSICYMWWEVTAIGGHVRNAEGLKLMETEFAVLDSILHLPNPACKEAALHGLGHMAREFPRACVLIDGFIDEQGETVGAELLAYAGAARTGCIQ